MLKLAQPTRHFLNDLHVSIGHLELCPRLNIAGLGLAYPPEAHRSHRGNQGRLHFRQPPL